LGANSCREAFDEFEKHVELDSLVEVVDEPKGKDAPVSKDRLKHRLGLLFDSRILTLWLLLPLFDEQGFK